MSEIKVANASAFWGDSPSAAAGTVARIPGLDYLTFDYLAELSLSIMALQMERSPDLGYAQDFIGAVESLVPSINKGNCPKILSNAGGLNPAGLAHELLERIEGELTRSLKIGVVTGDNVLSLMDEDLDTANAYLGAREMARLLDLGVDIVITGRVTDPSLTVAAAAHHFGWSFEEYDKLAAATVAGHLIECGRQLTGGISTDWLTIEDPVDIPFPFARISAEGEIAVCKPKKSGGAINKRTVTEQLLYEIFDPTEILSPDVICDISHVSLEEVSREEVAVRGARGRAPTNRLKVSATKQEGVRSEGMLVVCGDRARKKAQRAGEVLLERLQKLGARYEESCIELLGAAENSLECVLRVAVRSKEKRDSELFAKELASLVTSGPQGIAGYASGRPRVRAVYRFVEKTILKEQLQVESDILEVVV